MLPAPAFTRLVAAVADQAGATRDRRPLSAAAGQSRAAATRNMPRPLSSMSEYLATSLVCGEVDFGDAFAGAARRADPNATDTSCCRCTSTLWRTSKPQSSRLGIDGAATVDVVPDRNAWSSRRERRSRSGKPADQSSLILASPLKRKRVRELSLVTTSAFGSTPSSQQHDGLVDVAGNFELNLAVALAGRRRLELGDALFEIARSNRRPDRLPGPRRWSPASRPPVTRMVAHPALPNPPNIYATPTKVRLNSAFDRRNCTALQTHTHLR